MLARGRLCLRLCVHVVHVVHVHVRVHVHVHERVVLLPHRLRRDSHGDRGTRRAGAPQTPAIRSERAAEIRARRTRAALLKTHVPKKKKSEQNMQDFDTCAVL